MLYRSVLHSHYLHYRLWIAEINFYVNVLRILDDSVKERAAVTSSPAEKKKIAVFNQSFTAIRTEKDEVKHEIHLCKMRLAAYLRANKPEEDEAAEKEKYVVAEKLFLAIQLKFEKLKKEYLQFEAPAQQ